MISTIIKSIASQLVTVNSEWLEQIRTVGYFNQSDSDNITNEECKEIGLDDRNGNSGYIMFRGNQNFSVSPISSISSTQRAFQYRYSMRLVVVIKTNYPVDINYLLSLQLNHLFAQKCRWDFGTASNIVVQTTGGGSNTVFNSKEESGKPDINTNYKIVYLDFNIQFNDNNRCNFEEKIRLPMDCNCENILDLGCTDSCNSFEMPFSSAEEITLFTEFNGNVVSKAIEINTSGNIVIDPSFLNADYTYNFHFVNSEGERVTYEVDGTVYDCFKIKIQPLVQ